MSSLGWVGSFRDHISLTRSGSFRPVAAGGLQLDVQRGDAEGLDLLGDVLRGQHGGVWDDSSLSAFTFMPPVTRHSVSRPESRVELIH